MAKWFWHVVVIITVAGNSLAVCSVANAEDSALYKWTDEQGTVTFSDNPMTMPPKQSKRLKKRASLKAEPRQVQLDQDKSPIMNEAEQGFETYPACTIRRGRPAVSVHRYTYGRGKSSGDPEIGDQEMFKPSITGKV